MMKWLNINRILDFFKNDVWRIRADTLPRKQSILIKPLRIIILAFRGFDEDKCSLRASALTFYTLLSIVPLFAMAFGVAKGFGLEKLLEREVLEGLKGQEEVASKILAFSHSTLETARGGLIAGVGVAVLFWLIIKLLGNIEKSFNDIWGITHARSFGRKMSDYLSVVLICPLLLIMSSSATVFIKTQITLVTQKVAILGIFSPLILLILKALPVCAIWLLFTFLYIYMPNAKVRFGSGLLGGIVAGTIFSIVQWAYITFQIGVSRYGAIYGSFAALPLFLIWLQVSWLIVLLGTEISFASQNVETYEFEQDSQQVSHFFKKLLSLRIAQLCVDRFFKGEEPWNADQISHHLEVPIRLVNLILFELVKCKILSEVCEAGDGEPTYQPARDLETLSIGFVLHALDKLGSESIPVSQSEELTKISDYLEEMNKKISNSPDNLLLKNI
ncbi:YihY/virulence factor BrkB family protein [Thermodesulfobacteriota bacterium]